jgi:TPR repeat protein
LSADQGHAAAQFNFGGMVFHADGLLMNKSLAAHYFRLSADHGNAMALFNFSAMLFHSAGILLI